MGLFCLVVELKDSNTKIEEIPRLIEQSKRFKCLRVLDNAFCISGSMFQFKYLAKIVYNAVGPQNSFVLGLLSEISAQHVNAREVVFHKFCDEALHMDSPEHKS